MVRIVRGVSFLFAVLLLIGSILFAEQIAGVPHVEPLTSPLRAFLSVLGVGALLASGFIYAPILGERLVHSFAHQTIASVLLSGPIGLGAVLLMLDDHPEFQVPALLLTGLGVLVLNKLVWRKPARRSQDRDPEPKAWSALV